jgi:hypothetical protein
MQGTVNYVGPGVFLACLPGCAGFVTSEFGNPLAGCANAYSVFDGVVLKERALGRGQAVGV